MFCVDSICSGYAKDYLHLPLFPEQVPNVDNLFTFEGHSNYLSWCESNSFKQLPHFHYGQDAHDRLANLILQEIK
jgi:hypothetical protein